MKTPLSNVKNVTTQSAVQMQEFLIKTILLRKCRRCQTMWSGDHEQLEPGDQVNIVIVKIAYCLSCAESFAEETDRPTYERRSGKHIR